MADSNITPLSIKRNFLSSTSTVFNSWITPFFLECWLFKNETNQVVFGGKVEEGSRYSVLETQEGMDFDHMGTFLTIKNSRQLQFTLSEPKLSDTESEITIDLTDTGFGCEMTFTQSNPGTRHKEDDWQRMFTRLDLTLQQPYEMADSSSPVDIITAIKVVLMQMVGLSRPLTPEQINYLPATGGWSVGQLLNHVQKFFGFTGETLQLPGKKVKRDPTALAINFRRTFLDQTLKMSSPSILVPEDSDFDSAAIFADLDRRARPLTKQALSTDLNEELQGLPMGPVTKIELLLFTLYHSQRHLWQLAKIIDNIPVADQR